MTKKEHLEQFHHYPQSNKDSKNSIHQTGDEAQCRAFAYHAQGLAKKKKKRILANSSPS
jgi:hypothetical protein